MIKLLRFDVLNAFFIYVFYNKKAWPKSSNQREKYELISRDSVLFMVCDLA